MKTRMYDVVHVQNIHIEHPNTQEVFVTSNIHIILYCTNKANHRGSLALHNNTKHSQFLSKTYKLNSTAATL